MTANLVWQFPRLQKVGGDSFRHHLIEGFSGTNRLYHKHFEFEMVSDPDARHHDFFIGHISPAALHEMFDRVRVILLFRDPVRRLVSAYHYWRENAAPNAPASRFFTEIQSLSLLEFLTNRDPLFRNAVFNAQARLLAGGRFGMSNHTRTCVVSQPMPDRLTLELAKEAIDSAFFVGITEHMAESVRRFFTKAGLPAPGEVHHINRGLSRREEHTLTPAEVDALTQATYLDREIYDYALARFQGADP